MRFVLASMNPGLDRWQIHAEIPERDDVHRALDVVVHVSGKAVNVARALRTLGRDDLVVVNLVGGEVGRLIRLACRTEGIPTRDVTCRAENRINITLVDERRRRCVAYNEPGPEASQDEADAFVGALLAETTADDGGALVVGGSPPRGWDPGTLAAAATAVRRAGGRVVVDIAGPWLPALVAGGVDLLKVNRAEFLDAFRVDPVRDDAAVRSFLAAHRVAELVVTDGARGCVAWHDGGKWRASVSRDLHGYYSVGSGDSFLAGYLDGWSRGASMPERLALATACGVANTLVRGPATFDTATLECARETVEVRPV